LIPLLYLCISPLWHAACSWEEAAITAVPFQSSTPMIKERSAALEWEEQGITKDQPTILN